MIPPMFENATDEDGDPIVVQPVDVNDPTMVYEPAGNDSSEEPVINFVLPSSMRVTVEPLPEVKDLSSTGSIMRQTQEENEEFKAITEDCMWLV